MTASDPLTEAFALLRAESAKAEEHLATLDHAPIGERLAAAADVHAARLRSAKAEAALPGPTRADRARSAADALAPLFDAAETSTADETGLAGLFA